MQEPPISAKLQSQRLALLETFEELVEDADDDGIDASTFGFSPFFQLGTGLCANVEELRLGQFQTRLASLLNINLVMVQMAHCVKDDPGQIALYARLLGDGFAEIER